MSSISGPVFSKKKEEKREKKSRSQTWTAKDRLLEVGMKVFVLPLPVLHLLHGLGWFTWKNLKWIGRELKDHLSFQAMEWKITPYLKFRLLNSEKYNKAWLSEEICCVFLEGFLV